MEGSTARAAQAEARYRIDDLTIDVGRQCVSRGESAIALSGLSYELLLALVRDAPNLVSYDRLMERVWPGLVVSPETVTQRVKLVRDALGDDPRAPRYIAGIRGRGYRIVAQVSPLLDFEHGTPISANATEVSDAAKLTVSAEPTRRWWFAGAAVVALATAAILIGFVQLRERQPTSVVVRAPPRTIAVLPFVNLGGDAENEYFGDGLTEELINRVAQIPSLRVTARTSAFAHKGSKEDVRTIASKLGVATVLEGSVRRSGDRVRVTAQLINAQDGYHLWSDAYNRDISDIFLIHDEIANRIAQVIGIQVAEAASRRPTTNLAAYDLYLRGRTTLAQRGGEPFVRRAISYFEQAVALDPTFAHAQAGLAAALGLLPAYTSEPPRPIRERAAALARHALTLDPSVPGAHVVLGVVYNEVRHDFLAAEIAFRTAVEMHPNDAGAHYAYGDFLQTMGRLKEGYSRLLQARRLDPALSPLNWAIGMLEIQLGHLDEAEETVKVITQLGAKSAPGLRGYLALRRGDFARARREYDEYARVFDIPSFADEMFTRFAPGRKPAEFVRLVRSLCSPSSTNDTCYDKLVAIGDYEAAFTAARKGFAELTWHTDSLWHPGVASARRQPGFKDLVRDLGLVAYWRKYGWPDYCKPVGEDLECE